jgi:hypothetical protein
VRIDDDEDRDMGFVKDVLRALFAAGDVDEPGDGRPAPLPSKATRHLPGTPGKVRVMAFRARRGEQLFHPEDAQP